MLFEKAQPLTFKLRTCLPQELLQMLRTRFLGRSGTGLRLSQLQQEIADSLTVQQLMITLVVVGEQTIVTSRLTVFLCAWSTSKILTCLWIEVAEAQCFFGDLSYCLLIFKQPSEHASTTLCRLIEQDQAALVHARQGFCRQFVILKLIPDLDRAFEDRLQRRHYRRTKLGTRLK